MELKIKTLNFNAEEVYGDHGHFHDGDAGLDLYVLEDMTFGVGETRMVRFGIACQPVDGKAYFLIPRSSISKTPLRMSNSIGLIDGGYRGELMMSLDNIKGDFHVLTKGTRIAQLVAHDVSPITYQLVEELETTTRGAGGFGSTGV